MQTLHLRQLMPFARCPAFVELAEDKILTNDVCLPRHIDVKAFNPHNVRMWVIGHTFGPICAVWASNEQLAFDEAVDANLLDCFLIENPEDVTEETAYLGNASEPFDLSEAWIGEVSFDLLRDVDLILALVRRFEQGKARCK